jgi:Sigma-70, region 4
VTPEQAITQSEARRSLQLVLEKIPEEPRAVFILFELERLNTAQIAELLELPIGTVALASRTRALSSGCRSKERAGTTPAHCVRAHRSGHPSGGASQLAPFDRRDRVAIDNQQAAACFVAQCSQACVWLG